MKTYLTRYSMGGGHFGAYLEADNLTHARVIAAARGLNERIEGEIAEPMMRHRLAEYIGTGQWLEAAHEAAFLGFIGLSSGALTPREVLGDTGLVHELLHLARPYVHHPDEAPEVVAADDHLRAKAIEAVTLMARDFECRVPGHQPSFAPDEGE